MMLGERKGHFSSLRGSHWLIGLPTSISWWMALYHDHMGSTNNSVRYKIKSKTFILNVTMHIKYIYLIYTIIIV